MAGYEQFANIYDSLISADIDYSKMADFIQAAFTRYGVQPELVLDLGCGTGSLAVALAGRGYDMIGVDLSIDMLSVAREKNSEILFLNQDMRELELYGTVDAVLSMTDSLNYITEPDDLQRVFKLVRNYLNPGAPFIFDVNSPYKLSNIIGNHTFTYDDGDILYVWTNEWDEQTGLANFDLSFFVLQESGFYRRFDEVHCQKAYEQEYLWDALKRSGFQDISVFDGLSFDAPHKTTERYLWIAR